MLTFYSLFFVLSMCTEYAPQTLLSILGSFQTTVQNYSSRGEQLYCCFFLVTVFFILPAKNILIGAKALGQKDYSSKLCDKSIFYCLNFKMAVKKGCSFSKPSRLNLAGSPSAGEISGSCSLQLFGLPARGLPSSTCIQSSTTACACLY